jgi:hypothetical protein
VERLFIAYVRTFRQLNRLHIVKCHVSWKRATVAYFKLLLHQSQGGSRWTQKPQNLFSKAGRLTQRQGWVVRHAATVLYEGSSADMKGKHMFGSPTRLSQRFLCMSFIRTCSNSPNTTTTHVLRKLNIDTWCRMEMNFLGCHLRHEKERN